MSLALHYWTGDAHHCSGPLVSEMTYTVSSGTLNSTIPYILTYIHTSTYTLVVLDRWVVIQRVDLVSVWLCSGISALVLIVRASYWPSIKDACWLKFWPVALSCSYSGQVVHVRVTLSSGSIVWYRPKCGETLWLGWYTTVLPESNDTLPPLS